MRIVYKKKGSAAQHRGIVSAIGILGNYIDAL